MPKIKPYILVLLSFSLGMALDFILVGIFKVIWFPIYATTYFAVAMSVETYFLRTNTVKIARLAAGAILVGAAIIHIIMVGRHSEHTYSLHLVKLNPLILQSSEFPELLYLSGSKLSEAIAKENIQAGIPMLSESTTDYGCRRSFKIISIDHIDLASDPSASWTMRATHPLIEKQKWLWCNLQFYRPSN